jgi:hypothetical protein
MKTPEAYKWCERYSWERAWDSWLEEDIISANCPEHHRSRLVFVAGYMYKLPDGTTITMSAGWVCLSCLSRGISPVKTIYRLDGRIDVNQTIYAKIEKITPREYAEKTKKTVILTKQQNQ